MPFGRKSPLEALALPGVMLAYKYSQFRQRRREAASRRITERELSALHHKIDKLLSKLEESEPDPPTSQEDECVICINARATMQTSPCGHRVVCRRCFVKTIQSAVAQRLLPLRCVICRARVNRLTSSSGTWRIQESASSYSMGSKSWASASLGASSGSVPASASSYSMGDNHSGHGHAGFHSAPSGTRYPRSPNGRVAQSASLYSMSSGSSTLSSVSNATNFSKTSSVSSGLYSPSPSSPISPSASATSYASVTSSVLNNHLAPPGGSHSSSASLSPGSGGSLSPRDLHHHHSHQHQHHQTHSHHAGCPSGCSGAVPRKPLQLLGSSSSSSSSNGSCGGVGMNSGIAVFTPTTHTYPGRRHTKGRLVDLQNRLPPIKEFRSPAKVPHPSPVHISNPRFRYSSYTKSATNPQHEMLPLLCEPPSPPRRPLNIQVSSSLTTLGPPPLKANSGSGGLSAKISPLQAKNMIPKNAYTMPKDKKGSYNSSNNLNGKINNGNLYKNNNNNNNFSNILSNNNKNSSNNNINNKKLLQDFNANTAAPTTGVAGTAITTTTATTNSKMHHHRTSASSRSFPLFSSSSNNHKEKADNKKNESMERKKKEEKLKLKAEKEARKEEKRMAKEEERLAKLIAKEEKKKGKKEAKELLIANDGNNKK